MPRSSLALTGSPWRTTTRPPGLTPSRPRTSASRAERRARRGGDDAEADATSTRSPTSSEFEEEDEDDETAAAGRTPARTRASAPGERRGPGRFIGFLRASWAELQRVQWPDRRQVAQATAVVLGFVVVAGVYLGVADRVAQEVVDLII